MTSAVLWQLSVTTSAEAEEPVAELLTRLFNQPACVFTDMERNLTRVSIYCAAKPDWSPKEKARLRQGLDAIRGWGLSVGSGRVALKRVKRQDWRESWKRHFKPIRIGSRLLIKPSWSRQRAGRNQSTVILDPGLSFGTGQHPTTGFCLEQLVRWREPGKAQSFLDVGTGSGILAISAACLDYTPVMAFDLDPDAVRIARANARLNRVSRAVRFEQQDLTRMPLSSVTKFSLICANLISTLLLQEQRRLLARLAPAGRLVLAGILGREFAVVREAYETAGLRLVASRREREWRSGCFAWAGGEG